MTASVGRGIAMNASQFWSLESILPRCVSNNTVLEWLLPQKCFLLCLARCLSALQPDPSGR